MEGWVIALIVILALLMAGISGLVGYLLFRPRDRKRPHKKGLSPDGQIATEYDGPPKNGDVKVIMPEELESSLPPYSSNESTMKGKPKDVRVDVDEESTPEDKGLLEEVKVHEPEERPVDVGQLEKEAPPADVDDQNKPAKSTSSSLSSSDNESDEETLSKDRGSAPILEEKKKKLGESSSSSSDNSDVEIPEPMPDIEPHIVREEEQTPKGAFRDSPDLVSDVLAAVDDKNKDESSSSSSSDEHEKGVKVYSREKKKSGSSSSSDVNKAKGPPKPKERTKKSSDEGLLTKSSESSSSSSDGSKRKTIPVVVPRKKKSSSTSSPTSSSDDDTKKVAGLDATAPPTKRRSRRKKKPKTKHSSSSSSDSEDGKTKPRDAKIPAGKKKLSTSSSSSSDSADGTKEQKIPVVISEKKSSTSSSSSSDEGKLRREFDAPLYATPRKTGKKPTKKESKDASTTSSSDDITIRGTKRPVHPITFQSGWGKPVKLSDLCKAGLVDDKTAKALEAGYIPKDDVERHLRPYLVGTEPVAGILIMDTGEPISPYSAWKRGLITKATCLSLLEAQAATGRILDPKSGGNYSVEQALKAGLIDKQVENILNRAERAVYGYTTASDPKVLSVNQAIKKRHVVENHGMPLLEAQIATGGAIDPKANHRVPIDVAFKRGLIDKRSASLLQHPGDGEKGYADPNTGENVTYAELISRCVMDRNSGMKLYPLHSTNPSWSLPREKPVSKPGVNIVTQTEKMSSSSSSTSSSSSSEAEMEISIGTTEIATQTPDFLDQKKKKKKITKSHKRASPSIERPHSFKSGSMQSSESEREMYRYSLQGTPRQGARPFSPPRAGQSVSPHDDRSTQTLFPPKTKGKKVKAKPNNAAGPIIITMAEKDVQTTQTAFTSTSSSSSSEDELMKSPIIHRYEKGIQMTPPSPSSSSSSFSEEKVRKKRSRTHREDTERKVVEKLVTSQKQYELRSEPIPVQRNEKGIQMTPPASSSSSESEEEIQQKRIRTQRDITVTRVDEKIVSTGAYGDERKTVTSQTSHKVHTEPEPISVDLGKPEDYYKAEKMMDVSAPPKHVYFMTSWGRQVDLNDLYDAKIVDLETKIRLERGELDPSDKNVVRMVSPYITGNRPVAGILHTGNGKKYSIFEAAKRGLIRRSTAVALLEAQAATGNLIDPHTGKSMTVEQAQKRGFIEGGYEAIIIRAERAVHGYKTQSSTHPLSVFEAMKKGIVVPSHGIHLLEAQLATGGIIDPKANHRVPLEAAYRRKLFDQHAMNRLNAPGSETKGFVDPNTQKSTTYLEIIAHCVTDVETGVLLFPLEAQERGRSPNTSAHLSSYASLEVKSPSRSRSRERRSSHEISVSKPSSSSQTSSSDESRKRMAKEIKTASTSIELTRTPVMSGDDDDGFGRRDKKQVSTTTVEVESTYRRFEPVEFEVEIKQEDTKKERSSKSSSSSSSSSEDEKMDVVQTTYVKAADVQDPSMSEVSTTTTTVTTTETITERKKKSRDDIKFKSGWNRQASLANLLAAGVVTQKTVKELEEGIIQEEEVEKNIQQYLVGAEPIAGILISETGEKISIYSAWRKGLIRRGTSISLLEAQAATGRILDPKAGKRYSVEEASKEGLIDRQFEAVLIRAERAVFGYTTRTSPDVISLFQAMKRGLVVENHGIRLLEAQIATGGIIDPNVNHRLPVEVAYERGLFDKRMNVILEDPSDDTRGFFDPNTEENLTYFELMERCITDTDTGMRLLPLRTHRDVSAARRSKVVFESRTGRQVTVTDLVNANRLDQATAKRIDQGTITRDEKEILVAKLRVFVDGTMPIAGVINTASGERMSIYEAAKSELIRRGTAFELLEAQSCCGKLIDAQTGKIVTIETALRSGVIDKEFKDVVERAHRAVSGYREPFKRELLSLCEAVNRHLVVKRHGIRLLEAQIATGGIIDVKSPVRISPQVALKRALIDAKLAEDLENKTTQSYFDPVTGENLNYSELMGRCVTDKDTGLLYLMVEGGTVTGYVRPFEPEHTSKIRSQSASPGRITTEEVTTTKSSSASKTGVTEVTTTVESSEYVRTKRRKKRTKQDGAPSTSSGSESTGTESLSIFSRKVVIVDPDTNEEITVKEALKRRLIDKETAKQLIAQQVEYEETT